MRLDGERLMARLPPVRGRLRPMQNLAALTWFRVGGPAEVLFQPEDEDDLASLLAQLPGDVPVSAIGVGSNLLVRDGGVPGVVVRPGRGFGGISVDGSEITAGAAVPDAKLSVEAARAGIAGLEFLRGIPGAVGGALAMNAGAYGREVKDILVSARGVDRAGRVRVFDAAGMGFSYRHANAAEGMIFTSATFGGERDDAEAIMARMDALLAKREAAQPVRERTGGSTFRNPAGHSSTGRDDDGMDLKAWTLIERAGCRGLRVGGAQVSEKHCNFLINAGTATAADLETLGETVRARVKAATGHDLHWEIRRIGVILDES